MVKSKVCIAAALCVLSFFVVLSCSKPQYVLRFDCPDAGAYKVDVAKWFFYKNPVGDTDFVPTVSDAEIKGTAYYVQPGDGMAHYSGSFTAFLNKYEITWPSDAKIPKTSGGLALQIISDPTQGKGSDFTIVVVPATSKDTVTTLVDLRADPGNGELYNGELVTKATVRMSGIEQTSGDPISGQFDITVVFSDYQDPNNLP